MKCLNLGCGTRFHRAWINIDYAASDPAILAYDLNKGIPFPHEEFDIVYHSHLLEHISRSSVAYFLQECFRVLKPGGIMRVAVPDLERIAKTYLQALEGALEGDKRWQENYEWMMLELYDQTIRDHSSGELGAYLSQENIPNKEFVLGRIGVEARQVMEKVEQARNNHQDVPLKPESRPTVLHRLYRFLCDPTIRREAVIRRVFRAEYELLQLGRFRRGGEIHLWMYDRYSLAHVLREAGFQTPQLVGPTESRIPGWTEYNLDTEQDGTVYKPDSLFMEAFK